MSVKKEKWAIETETQVIQTQQQELNEQQHLLIKSQYVESKQEIEEQQQTLAQQHQARVQYAQIAESNKRGRHLNSPVEEGAVVREPFRTTSISSTASTEKILRILLLKRNVNTLKQEIMHCKLNDRLTNKST